MDDPVNRSRSVARQDPAAKGHETSDARMFPVFGFIVVLGILISTSLVLMALLFNYLEDSAASGDRAPSALATPNDLPPEPRLDSSARGSLDEVLAEARRKLSGYRWVDKEAGVIQIPIDRAMELVVERGVPSWSGSEPGQSTDETR